MTGYKHRSIALVTAAAMTLTSFGVAPAFAASKPAKQSPTGELQTVELQSANADALTEFSSRRRHYRRGNAAAAAAFAAIIGGIATYAAAREYRKARERELQYHYGYYGAPYGYHRGPYHHWRRW
jgi:hypothetical protein